MSNLFMKKEIIIDFVLCLTLGYLGAHKFYEKKYGLGILYFFTFGIFGFGWLIDIVKLFKNIISQYEASNISRDKDNNDSHIVEQSMPAKTQDSIQKQNHIAERKKQYLDAFNKVKIISPTIDKYAMPNKQKLENMPYYTITSARKNTPLDRIYNFISIDVETTGLNASSDEIIEISAIRFINSEPSECMATLIKPKNSIPDRITNINNITDEMVINSPSIENIIDSFSNFIKGYNIVGYNLEFDLKFLYVNGLDLFSENRYFFDALDLARRLYKDKLDNFKLDTVANEMELYRTQAHRSTEDAFVTGIIFRDLSSYLKNN